MGSSFTIQVVGPNHADVKTTLLKRELGKKVKFEITFCSAFGVIEKTVGFFESSDRQTG